MSDQEFKIDEVFESAVAIVRNLPKEGPIKPSDGLKLKLYAYFKQATHGQNDTPKPAFYRFVESYKWDAWLKLDDMPKEEAMSKYIDELKQIMDTFPQEESAAQDNKHFEEILGKKFYDYWFNEWNNQKSREMTMTKDSHLMESSSSGAYGAPASTSSQFNGASLSTNKANDTQSNSSDNSSMSMLEEAHSHGGDGYKTPNSLDQCNITGQMSDQFGLAVLRLQHGLEETNSRLSKIEAQVAQSMQAIQSLKNQTHAKQTVGCDGNLCDRRSKDRSGCGGNKLLDLLGGVPSLHWFYLAYPLVLYALLRAFERRRRKLDR